MLIFQIAVGSFIGVSASIGLVFLIETSVERYKNRKDEISEFMNQEQEIVFNDSVAEPKIKIETLEGPMFASLGDYIIKGIKGEFYACKPDIFELTYDKL